jgi:formyl-CoA transferase
MQMNERAVQKQQRGGPLSGITILDLSAYLAGPYGCTLLGDMGANVIKVEPPHGDNSRWYPSSLTGESRAFVGANRGKQGVVLDLKKPDGLRVLLRLITEADVLVHNFRPGVAERLGMGYAQLAEAHPRLVYCAVTGYGQSGPLRTRAGYDQVLQTFTGICAMQGGQSGEPQIVNGSIVDYYAASMLAMGVTAALLHRERTGQGQRVEVSLLRSALAMQSARFVWAEGEARDAMREFGSGGITGLHPTRDGMLYLSANTPHFWVALCEGLGLQELAQDPRYDSIRKRAEHALELIPKVRSALGARTALEWEALFGDRVPCAAARSLEDMFDHPQVLAEDLVEDFDHPTVGAYRAFKNPVAFSQTPCPATFAAPTIGQHTREMLNACGVGPDAFDRLLEAGVLGAAEPVQEVQP